MRIVYCINSTFNSGGMERVLMTKANYLTDRVGHEVFIVTSQQHGRSSFFSFSDRIKFYDLGINYDEDAHRNLFVRTSLKWYKMNRHRKLLSDYLNEVKPDIVVSMFDYEFCFLHKIKDGSKKVLEFHFCKRQKIIEAQNFLMRLIQRMRIYGWRRKIAKYDKFVVLTEEDKMDWGCISNIVVIKNPIMGIPKEKSNYEERKILSIGRISFQKGFDRLVKVWALVAPKYPDWELVIRGGGDSSGLQKQVDELGISDSISIKPATTSISDEYLSSSILVMTSRYEGLPMVLMEAMSYGLPVIAFSFHCGPKDLISPAWGSIVPDGDIKSFALELMAWMNDEERRRLAGDQARSYISQFTQDKVLLEWIDLFNHLVES